MIDIESIWEAIKIVLGNDEAEKTIKSSLQSACATAVTTFMGGLLMGPPGIFIGASVGAAGMYMLKKDTFKPILRVIEEDLSPEDKRELVEKVQKVTDNFKIKDALMLTAMARNNAAFRETLSTAVTNFVDSKVHT